MRRGGQGGNGGRIGRRRSRTTSPGARTSAGPPLFVLGDTHGQRARVAALLRAAGLVDAEERWRGADAHLWFLGDFTDRGEDGVGCIALAMRLGHEARAAGGRCAAVVGNHDVALLAAHRFPDAETGGAGGTFRADWETYGGQPEDIVRYDDEHAAWIAGLPALALDGDVLLAHADSTFYTVYGRTVAQVNAAIGGILGGDDTRALDDLLDRFATRFAFWDGPPEMIPEGARETGRRRLDELLALYGARMLIHGHTPILTLTGQPPESVTQALIYADGHCADVDPGMYLGGPGFIHRAR